MYPKLHKSLVDANIVCIVGTPLLTLSAMLCARVHAPCPWPLCRCTKGYALNLLSARAVLAASDSSSTVWRVSFDAVVENAGFAAPDRTYALHLVQLQANGNICSAAVPAQQYAPVETWQGGGRLHVIEQCVFTGLPGVDTSTLYLALSDAHAALRHRPEYRILLHQGAQWEGTRGLNSLAHVTAAVNATTQPLFDAPTCTAAFVCTGSEASDFGHVLPVYDLPPLLRPSPATPVVVVEGNHITDASFESGGTSWDAYTEGFDIDTRSHSGHLSALVRNGAARQTVAFDTPYPTLLNLSGCSRPLSVTGRTTRY
eukprot:m.897909 g.897909  ORF g.897909 m.897909 type:complete len:314 (+) comp23671_c0_seq6:153-1094(+)